MRTRFGFTLALVLVAAFPAFAQRPNEGHPSEGPREQGQHGPEAHGPNTPRANQGHVPPPPPQRDLFGPIYRYSVVRLDGDHRFWPSRGLLL